MSFWEMLTLVGATATIFGASLTIYALINNRTLKEESRLTREEIRASREEIRASREEIRASREGTVQILSRIEKGQEEARKEMAEAIRYVAGLIVSEGEKTRHLIKT